jgi:hypothetical protein
MGARPAGGLDFACQAGLFGLAQTLGMEHIGDQKVGG